MLGREKGGGKKVPLRGRKRKRTRICYSSFYHRWSGIRKRGREKKEKGGRFTTGGPGGEERGEGRKILHRLNHARKRRGGGRGHAVPLFRREKRKFPHLTSSLQSRWNKRKKGKKGKVK